MELDLKKVRRVKKQQEDAWIRAFVEKSHYGVLGVCAEDQPYLNANNYVYSEADHALYFHRSKEGTLPKILSMNSNATYLISEMGEFIEGESAQNFSVEYKSVIIYGRVEEVTNSVKKAEVLQKLVEKVVPDQTYGVDYQAASEAMIDHTAVWCLKIDFWTGKQSG